MPATPFPPHVPSPPHELALLELERLGLEAARVLGRAGDVLVHFRKMRESVREDDVPLLREARRDVERARVVLEGLMRTHAIEASETTGK
jgi:hypothetical protein